MKALILEDDATIAKLFRISLEQIPNLTIDMCSSGAEFERLTEETVYDVIILDNNLPDTEGTTLLHAFRRDPRHQYSPAIMITADDTYSTKITALDAGATDFLNKPIDTGELIARMRNMIALRHYQLLLRAENENLEKLATIDSLTQVWNRRSFMDRVQREVHRAFRFDQKLTIAMLDADHFKRVNDTYGHATGDSVLVGIAQAATKRLRDIDIVGRLGGEEFALCLAQTPGVGGEIVANRIRTDIKSLVFAAEGEDFGISVSVGIAEWRRGETASDTLERADKALYQAKEDGRNCVVVAQ